MSVSAKARRLIAHGRVTPAGVAAVYTVVGDNATYRVVVGDGWAQCPCPAHRERCSHAEAAVIQHIRRVDADPALAA